MHSLISQFGQLFEFDFQANQKVLGALEATDQTNERMREIFSHILGAQELWYRRVSGGEYGARMVWPTLSPQECEDILPRNKKLWLDYLQDLSTDDLSRKISYTNSKGQHFENSVYDILMQVMMHGVYHRGQIALLLRQADVQPPATDYIVYVRGK